MAQWHCENKFVRWPKGTENKKYSFLKFTQSFLEPKESSSDSKNYAYGIDHMKIEKVEDNDNSDS